MSILNLIDNFYGGRARQSNVDREQKRMEARLALQEMLAPAQRQNMLLQNQQLQKDIDSYDEILGIKLRDIADRESRTGLGFANAMLNAGTRGQNTVKSIANQYGIKPADLDTDYLTGAENNLEGIRVSGENSRSLESMKSANAMAEETHKANEQIRAAKQKEQDEYNIKNPPENVKDKIAELQYYYDDPKGSSKELRASRRKNAVWRLREWYKAHGRSLSEGAALKLLGIASESGQTIIAPPPKAQNRVDSLEDLM